MKNKSTLGLGLLIYAVLVLLFFFWTSADARSAIHWICFGFTTFAMAAMLLGITMPRSGQGYSYSLTLPAIATWYFIATLIASIALMIFTTSVPLTVTVQCVLLVIFAIYMAVNSQANQATAQAVERREAAVSSHKRIIAQIRAIGTRVVDPAARKAVERLYDAAMAAPVRADSGDALALTLQTQLGELEAAVGSENWQLVCDLARRMETAITLR